MKIKKLIIITLLLSCVVTVSVANASVNIKAFARNSTNDNNDIKAETQLTKEQEKYGLLGYFDYTTSADEIIERVNACVNQNKSLSNLEISENISPIFMPRQFEPGLAELYSYSSTVKTSIINYVKYNTKYNIQRIDNNNIVMIYNLGYYFLYIVFERTSVHGMENWEFRGEYYHVTKNLQYEDFSSLKVGDNIAKIFVIDPVAKYDEEVLMIRPINPLVDEKHKLVSYTGIQRRYYRLLEDGLLEIYAESYKTDNADGTTSYSEYVITAMEFHPYGDIYSNDGTEVFNILRAEKPIELPQN